MDELPLELRPVTGPALQWAGKRPLRTARWRPAELREVHGEATAGWRNRLYLGDSLEVMGHILPELRGRVDLVLIDPPFASHADYTRTIRLRGRDGSVAFDEAQYTDTWPDTAAYLQFMYDRIVLCRELLAPEGAFFLHCDWHQGHRLRCILDEVFGADHFQNEIVWHYYNKLQGNVGRFASNHDTVLFYSRAPRCSFQRLRELRARPVQQIKRTWSAEKGAIVNAKGPDGKVQYVTSTHRTVDDVWRLSMLQPADRTEAVGFPTQKPESVVERIIACASAPGDLVLDCFSGSGTTAAVATKRGRRVIAADVHPGAVRTTLRRLLEVGAAVAAGDASIRHGLPPDGTDGATPEVFYTGVSLSSLQAPRAVGRARLAIADGDLVVEEFVPARLGERLPAADRTDWKALVDNIAVDLDHDGTVLRPDLVDLPARGAQVAGRYPLPAGSGRIRVQITDLIGDVWQGDVSRG